MKGTAPEKGRGGKRKNRRLASGMVRVILT